ncbi:hypothetical protein Drorol1_Dr00017976 [Drosera rotundifolia]
MREPSMVFHEAAAALFEERQTKWVYSRPVVVMDVLWNLGFMVVAAVVLGLSWDEKPGVPVKVLEQLSGQTLVFFQWFNSRTRYDPSTGIYGMDFYVVLECPGYRVGRYCKCKSRVGIQHMVTKEDVMKWFQMKHEERVILNKGQNLTSQGFGLQWKLWLPEQVLQLSPKQVEPGVLVTFISIPQGGKMSSSGSGIDLRAKTKWRSYEGCLVYVRKLRENLVTNMLDVVGNCTKLKETKYGHKSFQNSRRKTMI